MKILVYGAGTLGSLLTHFLCRAGNDVTLIAKSTYDDLKNNGLIVEHFLMKKTTVDHPKIVKKADPDEKYDIVFSVMQSSQQLDVLDKLAEVNAKIVILIGNNMRPDHCKKYICRHAASKRLVLFGFLNSMGHREGGKAVTGGLPITELVIGGLHSQADPKAVGKVKKALRTKGFKVTEITDMYAYYLYHTAELMPYCLMCYKVNADLKQLKRRDIMLIIKATKECFDYLKSVGITVMPPGEYAYYNGGAKGYAMFCLYRIMSKTFLGKLMVADHAVNGINEIRYIDKQFEKFRCAHPESKMPTWDKLRKYLPDNETV